MTDIAAPLFKKRANKGTNLRKRPATPPPDASSASDSDFTSDDEGVRVKRRKKEGLTTTSTLPAEALNTSKSTAYAADRSTAISTNEDATKASSWFTDAALAAKDAPAASTAPSEAKDGVYQGTAKYKTFIQRSADHARTSDPNANPTSARAFGPVKAAPTNVRAITVTDFAPDVCKDYKTTGFCGFGDSCKYLHAREDYKQGWQLDKEWESAGKKKKQSGGGKDDEELDAEEKMLRDIPFACVICKEGYKDPVITKCGHYFCQKCAMGRYMKEKKKTCAACGADTLGSFPVAKKLKGLLERKRLREKERQRANAEEVD